VLKPGKFLLNCLFDIEHLLSLCLPYAGKLKMLLLPLDGSLMTLR
jgi:hypothetical protein